MRCHCRDRRYIDIQGVDPFPRQVNLLRQPSGQKVEIDLLFRITRTNPITGGYTLQGVAFSFAFFRAGEGRQQFAVGFLDQTINEKSVKNSAKLELAGRWICKAFGVFCQHSEFWIELDTRVIGDSESAVRLSDVRCATL